MTRPRCVTFFTDGTLPTEAGNREWLPTLQFANEMGLQAVADPGQRQSISERVAIHLDVPFDVGHLLGRRRALDHDRAEVDVVALDAPGVDLDDPAGLGEHQLHPAHACWAHIPALAVKGGTRVGVARVLTVGEEGFAGPGDEADLLLVVEVFDRGVLPVSPAVPGTDQECEGVEVGMEVHGHRLRPAVRLMQGS